MHDPGATPTPPRPALNVVGALVALGPLRRDLVPVYHRWTNDLDVSRTRGLSWPSTLERELATYEANTASATGAWFTVYERETWRPIGVAGLYEIEARHARASFGITIGEANCRGKGYGTEATRLILDYGFTRLGLENVMLTVYEFNTAGRRAYEKAGFRVFGRRHRCSRLGQRLWDVLYMEALAADVAGLTDAAASVPTP